MRCQRILGVAALVTLGSGPLWPRPAHGAEVLSPASWAGQWDFVITYRDSQTGDVTQIDKISTDICPGEPLGLALFESVPSCQSTATDADLAVDCAADLTAGACRLQGSLLLELRQSAGTIKGSGEWTPTLSGDCLIAEPSGQTIEIAAQRRPGAPASGCVQPSTLAQKLLGQPVALTLADRPFAALAVDELEIASGEVDIDAAFTLGAGSDGIDPARETLRLQVGDFSTKVAAGSFKLKPARGRSPAEYVYEGRDGHARVEVKISRLAERRFRLRAHAERTRARRTLALLPVAISVGDDAGSAAARARRPRSDHDDCRDHDHDDDHDHDHDDRDGHGRRGE
jgi:hypothetical protein